MQESSLLVFKLFIFRQVDKNYEPILKSTAMENPINICLSFDEKYAQHAAVTMVSLMKNSSRKIPFQNCKVG